MRVSIGVRRGLMALLSLVALAGVAGASAAAPMRFEVSFDKAVQAEPLTGRLMIVASSKATPDPMMTIGPTGSPVFGADLEALKPGEAGVLDQTAIGFPVADLSKLPAGDYYVQALVSKYRAYKRADGRTIWAFAEPRRNVAFLLPGNLYSKPQKVHIDPAKGFTVKLQLTETMKDETLADTAWVKRVKIKSKVLSDWWGAPMYLSANVLLPKGWAEHPNALYPIAYLQSFDTEPFFIKTDPKSRDGDAGLLAGNLQTGYDFYQSWISDGFPRMLAVTVEQPCPLMMEAYSVNSANCGPFGDALVKELFPHIEKTFRAIGKPHARFVEGASTGGWESLSLQLKYPDTFGGAWIFNPDPVDFRHYQLIDIYKDDNAFSVPLTKLISVERPFKRTVEGQVTMSMRELSRMEAVMGSKGRSGFQLDGWRAIHSPVGPDGYPAPIWDHLTGKIDHAVAESMRANGYDLTDYARRNWATLGPKLRGKLNFIQGDMDWFYLNLAVYDFEAMVKEMGGPDYPARFVYGRPKKGHNWHHKDWAGVVREMADQAKANAPAGEDAGQWTY
jgi:putative esterase